MTRDTVQMRVGHTPLNQKIDRFFAERGMGVNPYSLRRQRLKDIILLEALSDSELASRGLDRDDILPHVFRDILVI